jgi:hypothetical protein
MGAWQVNNERGASDGPPPPTVSGNSNANADPTTTSDVAAATTISHFHQIRVAMTRFWVGCTTTSPLALAQTHTPYLPKQVVPGCTRTPWTHTTAVSHHCPKVEPQCFDFGQGARPPHPLAFTQTHSSYLPKHVVPSCIRDPGPTPTGCTPWWMADPRRPIERTPWWIRRG